MAKRRYALERGGPKQLLVRWRRGFKDFEVSLDGKAWKLDPSLLATGATLTVADGSSLFVQRVKRKWWSIGLRDELLLDRNGVPVPGSDGDPRVIGRRATSVLVLFGLLRSGFIALWLVFSRSGTWGGGAVAAEGLLLVVLGVLAAFGLRLPVLLGAGVLVAELVAAVASGLRAAPVPLLIQVLVIVHLIRAWRRMKPRQPQPSLASVFE